MVHITRILAKDEAAIIQMIIFVFKLKLSETNNIVVPYLIESVVSREYYSKLILEQNIFNSARYKACVKNSMSCYTQKFDYIYHLRECFQSSIQNTFTNCTETFAG